jgi:hypothetical protein
VVLGAHPTRIVQPPPLWQPQSVDLTPFVGGEVLIRFQYVSLPGREDQGFAIDNIAIPEIEFQDSADGEIDWTMRGWTAVENRVPQDMIVQAVTTGTDIMLPRVHRLIDPSREAISGEWTFALRQGESLILAVSGASEQTWERAAFDLRLAN